MFSATSAGRQPWGRVGAAENGVLQLWSWQPTKLCGRWVMLLHGGKSSRLLVMGSCSPGWPQGQQPRQRQMEVPAVRLQLLRQLAPRWQPRPQAQGAAPAHNYTAVHQHRLGDPGYAATVSLNMSGTVWLAAVNTHAHRTPLPCTYPRGRGSSGDTAGTAGDGIAPQHQGGLGQQDRTQWGKEVAGGHLQASSSIQTVHQHCGQATERGIGVQSATCRQLIPYTVEAYKCCSPAQPT